LKTVILVYIKIGPMTGRSPESKRLISKDSDIWWGGNKQMTQDTYETMERVAIDYLRNKRCLYVIDGYVGWEKASRIRTRVVCGRAYHALFMRNMMIEPTQEEIDKDFSGN
jgi:phosphoenolpyruvate carboxykinase (ATP)